MAYTRRQELMCTEAQMIEKPDVVLRDGEVIYIKMSNGVLRQKMGDGKTAIIDLPFSKVFDGSVVQGMGDSETAAMSQKSATANFVNHDSRISDNELRISANEKATRDNNSLIMRNIKRISNLKEGLPDDAFMTDDGIAYSKNVPENALPFAELQRVGGMTYKDEETNTLGSAPVTEVESVGSNLLDVMFFTNEYVSAVANDDGSITLTNTTATTVTCVEYMTGRLPAGTYTLHNILGSVMFWQTSSSDFDNKVLAGTSKTFVYDGTSYLRILLSDFGPNESRKCKVMLNRGATALPHTPYVEPTLLTIPDEVQALDGYGEGVNAECYNYIDLEKRQFVKCVHKVDLGTLTWTKSGTSQFYASLPKTAAAYTPNSLCAIYEASSRAAYDGTKNKTISTVGSRVWIMDSSYADVDAETFKTALLGVSLCYELKETWVKTTDVSEYIAKDNLLSVKNLGLLIFANEHSHAVPSTIEYQLEV